MVAMNQLQNVFPGVFEREENPEGRTSLLIFMKYYYCKDPPSLQEGVNVRHGFYLSRSFMERNA